MSYVVVHGYIRLATVFSCIHGLQELRIRRLGPHLFFGTLLHMQERAWVLDC
jgi:hypothetical protein